MDSKRLYKMLERQTNGIGDDIPIYVVGCRDYRYTPIRVTLTGCSFSDAGSEGQFIFDDDDGEKYTMCAGEVYDSFDLASERADTMQINFDERMARGWANYGSE